MRKRFHILLAVMAALIAAASAGISSMGAVKERDVDTITLEPEVVWEDEVPVDLKWKTEQDKGRWIEEMGIAGDSKSLVLVINNLEESPEEELFVQQEDGTKTRAKKTQDAGNSRLFYFSKGSDDQWREVFATNCYISGGPGENEDIYGVYRLESAFGSYENPGSLVSYQQITSKDYWDTDPDSEDFGFIYTAEPGEEIPDTFVNLEGMKAFSNYGMIIKPEEEGDAYPALVVNCQQASTNDRTFCGIQLYQSYLRILIQSIDEETRIMIAGELEDLEGM